MAGICFHPNKSWVDRKCTCMGCGARLAYLDTPPTIFPRLKTYGVAS